jgi:hypothetical protein
LVGYFGGPGAVAVGVVEDLDVDQQHRVRVAIQHVISGDLPPELDITPPPGWHGEEGTRYVFLMSAYGASRPELYDWRARLVLAPEPGVIALLSQWPKLRDGHLAEVAKAGEAFRPLLIDSLAHGEGDTFAVAAHMAAYTIKVYIPAGGGGYRRIDILDGISDDQREKLNSALRRSIGSAREREAIYQRLMSLNLVDDPTETVWKLIEDETAGKKFPTRSRSGADIRSMVSQTAAVLEFPTRLVKQLPDAERVRLIERMEAAQDYTLRRVGRAAREEYRAEQLKRERSPRE